MNRNEFDGQLASIRETIAESAARPYYDEAIDAQKQSEYYGGLAELPGDLFSRLHDLLQTTHVNARPYAPAQRLYPWVDLHPDNNLVSIYSQRPADPELFARQDLEAMRRHESALAILESLTLESASAEILNEALAAGPQFNCEHVVPQSWFAKKEPMRGDLHHLFACEPTCNSFRGNDPYFDAPGEVRSPCGERRPEGFKPKGGKGAVARATLYFLVRHPGLIDPTAREYLPARIATLLQWHRDETPTLYERHRNAAIHEAQGNRNPFVDHPDWADRVDFTQGLGHAQETLFETTDEILELARGDLSRRPELSFRTFEVSNVTAAVSPDSSYRFLRDALASASNEVLIYIYNATADYLLDLVGDCLRRGVSVRIMYDATDTRGHEIEKLAALGVPLKAAPSKTPRAVFTVCHQKFVVIDGSRVIVESANWADTSVPRIEAAGDYRKGNREWFVRVDDEPLAQWFATLFERDWDIPEVPALTKNEFELESTVLNSLPELVPARTNRPSNLFDIQRFESLNPPARVTPIVSPDNYFEVLIGAIRGARSSVDIQQQYILAGGADTREILAALRDLPRAVEIRIIISVAFSRNWDASLDTLREFGLADRVKALNPRMFTHCHNKGVIVDRNAVVVSSTNWSENSITRAREAGLFIESGDVAAYFAQVFDTDWADGLLPGDAETTLRRLVEESLIANELIAVDPADLA